METGINLTCCFITSYISKKQYPQGESNPIEEHTEKTTQALDRKDFTDEKEQGQKNHFDTNFDSILQTHPELASVIQAWPELPETTKAAIMALMQTQNKKE